MYSRRMKKGFTLAELLIVVAIIGVLVAIAIPVFSGMLSRAKEATCKANRRSLYGQVVMEQMLSDKTFSEVFDEYVGSAGKCPCEGTFSWEDSGTTGIINCSYHDGSGSSGGGSESGSGGTPALHATPNLTAATFQRGAVIQDETGTAVLTHYMEYLWNAYSGGATVAQLAGQYGDEVLTVDPSNIKDSSLAVTLQVGDLYYDSTTGKYIYVTLVSANGPIGIELLQ